MPSGLLLTLINIVAPQPFPDGPLVSAGRSAGPCCGGELTRAHNTQGQGWGLWSPEVTLPPRAELDLNQLSSCGTMPSPGPADHRARVLPTVPPRQTRRAGDGKPAGGGQVGTLRPPQRPFLWSKGCADPVPESRIPGLLPWTSSQKPKHQGWGSYPLAQLLATCPGLAPLLCLDPQADPNPELTLEPNTRVQQSHACPRPPLAPAPHIIPALAQAEPDPSPGQVTTYCSRWPWHPRRTGVGVLPGVPAGGAGPALCCCV